MNVANIRALADAIERGSIEIVEGLGFNMSCWLWHKEGPWDISARDWAANECGTVACMAGWEFLRLGGRRDGYMPSQRIFDVAKASLGLTAKEAHKLFEPEAHRSSISPAIAVATLRHFADTGEIDYLRFGARMAT